MLHADVNIVYINKVKIVYTQDHKLIKKLIEENTNNIKIGQMMDWDEWKAFEVEIEKDKTKIMEII